MKDNSKEMETMELDNCIRQFREDLPEDVLQSAGLVLAAWQKRVGES